MMRRLSLNLRIILSAIVVLVIFLTLTAAALDRAFIDSTESAMRDSLSSQLYALMAAAEVTDDGILMPASDLDALLGLPASGLYAQISGAGGNILWQSSSLLASDAPAPLVLPGGEKKFSRLTTGNRDFYRFSYGVNWATANGSKALTFNMTTDLVSFEQQIHKYRTTLWSWLSVMALLLLTSQAVILRWGLLPLRRVGVELDRIESGRQQQIEEKYPQEIEQLTRNINLLLQQEREQKSRYRNALGDLAHSLKTPLAVMQNYLGKDSKSQLNHLQQQVAQMNSIVEYQLQRAATAGSASIGQAVAPGLVIDRLLQSLHKVYRDKTVNHRIIIKDDAVFRGDEGDLMELLGNLLDNAFKWCRHHIDIVAEQRDNKLFLSVSDDGPGIDPAKAKSLLQRGVRADQSTAGHGIGLSIVSNIVDAYHGELTISRPAAGGCEVRLIL